MELKNIIYEKSDSISRIILNRPDLLNALWVDLWQELDFVLDNISRDDSVKVVIIKGAGRAFASGSEIKPYMAALAEGMTSMPDRQRVQEFADLLLRIWDLNKPVIAQIHGYCLAGGLDLAMVCDIVIAAKDAQFGRPEVRTMGVGPMAGIFPWLIGIGRAKELHFTGDMISGEEAERIGLINKAVPINILDETVDKLAKRIAKMPADLLELQKMAMNRSYDLMGFRLAVRGCVDFDVFGHFTSTAQMFAKSVQENGVKEALRKANEPFKS